MKDLRPASVVPVFGRILNNRGIKEECVDKCEERKICWTTFSSFPLLPFLSLFFFFLKKALSCLRFTLHDRFAV